MIRNGDWVLLECDPQTGRRVWALERDDGSMVFRTEYPEEGTMAANAAARGQAGRGWAGDWHRVASVPLNLLYDAGLHEAVNQQDDRYLSRWLNDSDNRAWRTKDGRL